MPACEWVAQSIELHHRPNLAVKHPIPLDKTAAEICRRFHWWTKLRKTGDVLRSTSFHQMSFHINNNLLRPSLGFRRKQSDLFLKIVGDNYKKSCLQSLLFVFFPLSIRLYSRGNGASSPDPPHTSPAPAVSQERPRTWFSWFLTTHFFSQADRFLCSLRGSQWWSYLFLKTPQGWTKTNWLSVRLGDAIKKTVYSVQ